MGSRLEKQERGGKFLQDFIDEAWTLPPTSPWMRGRGPAQLQRRGMQAAPAGRGTTAAETKLNFVVLFSICNLKKQRGLLPRGLPTAGHCVN
jgi:hypothetical protein